MFMRPNIVQISMVEIDTTDGVVMLPVDHLPLEVSNVTKVTAIHADKWFSRLSAPGYLDCTDWIGPFDDEREALEALFQLYSGIDEELSDWENEVI